MFGLKLTVMTALCLACVFVAYWCGVLMRAAARLNHARLGLSFAGLLLWAAAVGAYCLTVCLRLLNP